MTVVNGYGVEINFDMAVNLMDDDLREKLHAELAPCSEQKFFDEYAERHAEKYGEEDWQPAQANPIM